MFFTAFEKAKQSKQKTLLQSYESEIKILTCPGLVQLGFEQPTKELHFRLAESVYY